EQRAIADYLDRETARIDALMEEQQRLIELLRERRQSVIESAAGRGLDGAATTKASGLSWVTAVPAHWLVANIRRFASMKTGHTPSRSKPDYWVDCTIPWFTLADVWQLRDGKRTYLLDETANRISPKGLENSAAELLPAGTVVLSRTASVGFSGVMPVPMATSQDFWNWVPGDELDSIYLMWVLRAMQREFRALMIGSTHQTIYQPTAAAIRIPVPPLDEQRRIAAYLDEQTAKIDILIAETERFVELSRERRSALITAAVTGQIDVRAAA
ncbi:MAG TPA: restriction endonuclease subunit S, partial [Mycobacterium sp.]|nr:restriction endonuclease subunit S [Mycobacterium sp.]